VRLLVLIGLVLLPALVLIADALRNEGARPPSVSLVYEGDSNFSGVVGQAIPQLTLHVRDDLGAPVAGVRVRWSVLAGGGRVHPRSATSDDSGAIVATWTLGRAAGRNELTAALSRSPDSVITFVAMGEPDVASSVVQRASESADSAGDAVTLQVADRFGNAVSGAAITLQFGRSGPTDSLISNDSGLARSTRLPEHEHDSLIVSVAGVMEVVIPPVLADSAPSPSLQTTSQSSIASTPDTQPTPPPPVVTPPPRVNRFNWVLRMSGTPPGRVGHRIAFDQLRGVAVLFGGAAQDQLGDMWVWSSSGWAEVRPPRLPTPRVDHAMEFDGTTGIILFGGSSGTTIQDDVWLWDGTDWSPITLSNSPPGRFGHAMAYDPVRRRVVMFGGMGRANLPLRDTWEWDGTEWRQAVTAVAPPPRVGHAMCYDARRGRIVLFGGSGIATGAEFLNDTWEWDGSSWSRIDTPTSPPGLVSHSMAFDASRGRVIVFGGSRASGPTNQTWEYDGNTWTRVTPIDAPEPRESAIMFYDQARRRVILYGGSGEIPYSDTWEYRIP